MPPIFNYVNWNNSINGRLINHMPLNKKWSDLCTNRTCTWRKRAEHRGIIMEQDMSSAHHDDEASFFFLVGKYLSTTSSLFFCFTLFGSTWTQTNQSPEISFVVVGDAFHSHPVILVIRCICDTQRIIHSRKSFSTDNIKWIANETHTNGDTVLWWALQGRNVSNY